MAPRDQREVSSDEDSAPAGDLRRRGPWTVEEDLLLVNYIAAHGEGRWNALARCAGLRRTGKSCRLRWLNYLRPDLRRGNITAQEQLLILELHSRWGNRWSKIAQHLPGRTDNEIKNYWRTRVQKHARQLNCDVNSQRFKDLIRYLWMPRLLERIAGSGDDAQQQQQQQQLPAAAWPVDDVELSCTTTDASSSSPSVSTSGTHHHQQQQQLVQAQHQLVSPPPPPPPPPAAPSAAFGESAPSGNTDSNNSTAAVWDTLYCQPPPPPTTAAAETACSWSDESLLGDMGMGLPELGDDTMLWGAAGADDLWYTQIMGL